MNKKKHPIIWAFKILIFFFSILFYYTSLNISIRGITPLMILPILTAFSFFHSPLCCAFTGLACGIFMDCCAIDSYCFNAIVLIIISVAVSVVSENLFNKNIQSATVLCLISCTVYFILHWIVFHTHKIAIKDTFIYLLNYAFPSIILSAVFIFPFYYLYRHFNKLTIE